MKRVLLTGGNGFIGTRFNEAHRHNFDIHSFGSGELNILDRKKIEEIFKILKPDYVIHAAAIALTDFCNNNPDKCYEINVTGAVNIAEACKKTGSKMIFLSTEQVFNGNPEPGPYSEGDTPVPDTIYGKNKLEAEGLIKNILDDYLILRFTWMFGMPERFRPVVANILWSTIETALKGEQIEVPSNEFRGLTYVNELMDQFDKIIDLPSGTYHIGSENSKSRYDIVCLILEEMGLGHRISELVFKDTKKYASHPRDVRLNISLIKSHGITFSNTEDAIICCIDEYNLKVK